MTGGRVGTYELSTRHSVFLTVVEVALLIASLKANRL